MELLFTHLRTKSPLAPRTVAEGLWRDYQRGSRHDMPGFLREHLPEVEYRAARPEGRIMPKRQSRHAAVN
jgi:hypothetical protein